MNTAKEVDNWIKDWKNNGMSYAQICVDAAKACLGWAYVFGARGDYCEPANRRSRYSDAHPTIKSKCQNFNGKSSAGCEGCKWYPGGVTRCFDCRGFTYWIVKQVTGQVIQGAGATSQYANNSNWSEKGLISNMPDVVCCVFKYDSSTEKMEHTGLHIGGGQIIHCSNGVQTGKTTDRGWTHYAIPTSLKDQGAAPTPGGGGGDTPIPVPVYDNVPTTGKTKNGSLTKGSKGKEVLDLQKDLLTLGYSLPNYGADGSYGTETVNAVKQFQRDHGLTVDGIAGKKTLAAVAEEIAKRGDPQPEPTPEPTPSEEKYIVHVYDLTVDQASVLASQYPNTAIEKN